uniref:RING-type domain-containing protein n=1 Tax=Parastrongyloides trichosuri TaxID=131310 RepID=A0A0N5A5B5_PARTI
MHANLAWRKAQFYEENSIESTEYGGEIGNFLCSLDLVSIKSLVDYTFFAVSGGVIFILDKKLKIDHINVFDEELIYFDVVNRGFAAIGSDKNGENCIKIFYLERKGDSISGELKNKIKLPKIKVDMQLKPKYVTIDELFRYLVVNFANGSVYYTKSDLSKNRHKYEWIHVDTKQESSSLDSTTGVKLVTRSKNVLEPILYIMSKSILLVYDIKKDAFYSYLDNDGCEMVQVWDYNPLYNSVIFASKEVVQKISVNFSHITAAIKYDNIHKGIDKLQILHVGKSIAVLWKSSHSLINLTIYDTECNINTYHHRQLPLKSFIFTINGVLYLLTSGGKLSSLIECTTSQKMELLLAKNMFDVAIQLGDASGMSLSHVHKKYGTYLLAKNDYENALKHFKKAIGEVETSFVIKSYLDGSKLLLLREYLEHLVLCKYANENHITLIVNLCIKTQDMKWLITFFKTHHPKEFDIDKGMYLLRKNKLYDPALIIALEYKEYLWFAQIKIDDKKDPKALILFMSKHNIDKETFFKILSIYSTLLLREATDEFLNFIRKKRADIDDNLLSLILINGAADDIEKYDKLVELCREENVISPKIKNIILRHVIQNYDGEKYNKTDLVDLIDNKNASHAIHLAQIFNIPEVLGFCYGFFNYYEAKLSIAIEKGNFLEIVDCCRKIDTESAWQQAASYLAKASITNEEFSEGLKIVLEHDGLHPFLVLSIISKNSNRKFKNVKPYLLNILKNYDNQISEINNDMLEYQEQLESTVSEIGQLKTKVHVFDKNKCLLCDQKLTLPIISFICKHSFHSQCVVSYSINEKSCPRCDSKREMIKEAKPMIDKEFSYERFQKQITLSDDIVDVLGQQIRNGLFR